MWPSSSTRSCAPSGTRSRRTGRAARSSSTSCSTAPGNCRKAAAARTAPDRPSSRPATTSNPSAANGSLRKALEAERALRRRDRERYAWIHDSLQNARGTVTRLDESRARYRDLALRVEAAVLRAPARDDPGGLEDRLRRALRDAGFALPERRTQARSAKNSRAPPGGDSPPKRRKTS